MTEHGSFKSWLIWYLRQPFKMIVWFMETFAKNRKRLNELLARPGVGKVFRTVVLATFFGWLAVFALFASQEEGDRFTCAVKSLWPDADRTGCEPMPWETPKAPE